MYARGCGRAVDVEWRRRRADGPCACGAAACPCCMCAATTSMRPPTRSCPGAGGHRVSRPWCRRGRREPGGNMERRRARGIDHEWHVRGTDQGVAWSPPARTCATSWHLRPPPPHVRKMQRCKRYCKVRTECRLFAVVASSCVILANDKDHASVVPLLVRLPGARVGYVAARTGAQRACLHRSCILCVAVPLAPSRASPCAYRRRGPSQAKPAAPCMGALPPGWSCCTWLPVLAAYMGVGLSSDSLMPASDRLNSFCAPAFCRTRK